MGDKAIIVASFGTSYASTREKTIGGIEREVAQAFPEYEVRRAFTSRFIIKKLKEKDGIEIDTVAAAIDRAFNDGIKSLMILPTLFMDGFEYDKLKNEAVKNADRFDEFTLLEPLLSRDEDYEAVVQCCIRRTEEYDDGATAVIYMGHGTDAVAKQVYGKLQDYFIKSGKNKDFIATVEGTPTLEDVIGKLAPLSIKRVVLEPLLVVAGVHVNEDMAGDKEDSWKSILEGRGYLVEVIMEGLGELPDIREIYVSHVKRALN